MTTIENLQSALATQLALNQALERRNKKLSEDNEALKNTVNMWKSSARQNAQEATEGKELGELIASIRKQLTARLEVTLTFSV